MTQLMKLFNTYLGPASDTLLDLGAQSFRWNNLFIKGTNSSSVISASTVNTFILVANSSYQVGVASTGMTVSSMNVTGLLATSSLFIKNDSKSTLTTTLLTSAATAITNGSVWFQTSSNVMYLFVRSGSFNYFVAMNT